MAIELAAPDICIPAHAERLCVGKGGLAVYLPINGIGALDKLRLISPHAICGPEVLPTHRRFDTDFGITACHGWVSDDVEVVMR